MRTTYTHTILHHVMRILALVLLPLLLISLAAASLAAASASRARHTVSLPAVIADGLGVVPTGGGFDQVTTITHAGDERLFIAQREGKIITLWPDGTTSVFLDLTDRVNPNGAEYGFFDVAFHPGFGDPASPGRGQFFVAYTGNAGPKLYVIVSRFRVLPGAQGADPAGEAILLRVRQDSPLHKGGGLDFNKLDNYLYIGIGDDTADELAQDPVSLKGKVLRMAVDNVPADLVGNAEGRTPVEVWAMGLRNPWRLDVDEISGRIYLGDVGAGAWEEVNSVPLDQPMLNFGWPCREGFVPSGWGFGIPACDEGQIEFTDPEYAFPHDDFHCAIIGGSVYRGAGAAARYVFADLCSNDIYAMPIEGPARGQAKVLGTLGNIGPIISLGEDAAGRPYAGIGSPDMPLYRLALP